MKFNEIFSINFQRLLLIVFLSNFSGYYIKVQGQDILKQNNVYHSLDSAFQKIGFNPLQKDAWFFISAGDIHYKADGGSRGGQFIVNQIRAMRFSPAFYIIPGDVVNHMSLSMAQIPSENDIRIAKKEFQYAEDDLSRLPAGVNCMVTLGNHDTYPNEFKNPGNRVFYSYFDTVPKLFSYGGVHFLFIDNGSHANYDISNQVNILKNYYLEHIKPTETVIVIQHFPYVGQNYLMGLPNLLNNLFSEHTGDLWSIVGHDHVDRDRLYSLSKTRVIENTVSKGYTIYCVKNGKVIGRILHPRKEGVYTILKKPTVSDGKVLHAFEDIDGIVWQAVIGVDIGTSDCPYLISSVANDGITNWVYTKHLEYRFPYPDSLPKEFGLMTQRFFYSDDGKKEYSDNGKIYGSVDGSNWIQMPYKRNVHDVAIYEIPILLRKNITELFIKIEGPSFRSPHPAAGKVMDNTIGGFAFIK
jgi:hypothetical protein